MNGDLDKTKFPHGICPFMSGRLAPVSGPGGIVQHGQIVVSSVNLPCLGDKCQLWSVSSCSFTRLCALPEQIDNVAFRLADIGDSLTHLEPPKRGSGPIMRIADALEKLIETRSEKVKADNGHKEGGIKNDVSEGSQ